jgi:integrase
LDKLIGRHCADFAEAKIEAKRAWLAWLDGRNPAELQPSDRPTLAAVLDAYPAAVGRDVARCRAQARPIVRTVVNSRPFGEWPVDQITREMIETFRRQRPRVAANRDLGLVRAAFSWAVLKELVPSTPFKVGTEAAVQLTREDSRTRRLQAGEAERLALVAGGLHDIITAALETGCRRGELLTLQWHQIRLSPRAEVFLPATKTKTKRDRRVPISTVLRAVLDARRTDPAGVALSPDAYVFGDEIGRPRRSIKTAWRLTCRRAKIVGLHFHDLRREAGSRWMDAGIPLATIQRWLGHANISQTSTYLGASLGADELEMRVFEERMGRLTHVDTPASQTGPSTTATDLDATENTKQNRTVH